VKVRELREGRAMNQKITVDLIEARRVFELIERLHQFLHDPSNYGECNEFAHQIYPEVRDIYYDVIWGWFPRETQREYEER
jgi:hypothetical protein